MKRGRKKLTVVGPHLGHKAHRGHKGRRRKSTRRKKA